MKSKYSIGAAIHSRRSVRGWSLQRVCDETGGAIYPSSLSAIEKGDSVPSVLNAYALAKVFGTTVEALIEESMTESPPPTAPAESIKRVPVVPWEMAAEWALQPDIKRLPSGTPWELSPDNPPGAIFGLVVRDDTMHAPSGPTFPMGATIFVDPQREAEPNDFVVGHTGNPQEITFKKLIQDGSQRYLRALNPQFPMVSIDGKFQVVGVVVGMTMRVAKGLIR
ncbi:hypothetical protein 3S15_17 [uncultured Caudovirales phage]|uniref:HTH cro/C1-type domain-containing protein n=1 Tax=uncultured Caudovirales phage TaxID=2100421 RepID=A0A2H4JAB6_9CAUD|nr:hypothetical protein 3S15_17 [uncultured Caudovirales phage]